MDNFNNLCEKNQESIQKFLSRFKKVHDVDTFIFHFRCNPTVFNFDPLLPDLYKKTRLAFNKNKAFWRETLSSQLPENVYPKVAYVLPESCLKTTKVDVDDLFKTDSSRGLASISYKTVDVFSEEFKLGKDKDLPRSESNISVKDSSSSYKNSLEDTSLVIGKSFGDDSNKLLNEKKWFISVSDICVFGPYKAEEIYIFVNNILKNTNNETENHYFMVVDSETDIYYEPNAVLEHLEEAFPSLKGINTQNELEKLINDNHNVPLENIVFKERKKSENPQLVTKFDLVSNNNNNNSKYNNNNNWQQSKAKSTKYSNAQYLPLPQLGTRIRRGHKQSFRKSSLDYYGNTNQTKGKGYRKSSLDYYADSSYNTYNNNNYGFNFHKSKSFNYKNSSGSGGQGFKFNKKGNRKSSDAYDSSYKENNALYGNTDFSQKFKLVPITNDKIFS